MIFHASLFILVKTKTISETNESTETTIEMIGWVIQVIYSGKCFQMLSFPAFLWNPEYWIVDVGQND